MEQQSKKTMRHFYCRDVLWETFEQMAQDFDCSIEYLLNEAMRSYARLKKYPVAAPDPSSEQMPADAIAGAEDGAPHRMGALSAADPGIEPASQAIGGARTAASGTAAGGGASAGAASSVPTGRSTPIGLAVPPRQSPSRPMPIATPPRTEVTPGGTLVLLFNDQRIPIEKDQFIIGRGSKTSDLPIKDGNISRKHAAVIRRNGTYYIKDLGSTNGIDYRGLRIDNKRIDDGDVFYLCDYELKFIYQDS